MNVYKFYFSHLIKAVEKFKSDFKYSFILEDILKKLTLEPPKNSINGDMSTNLAMILSKDLKLSPKIIAENFMVYISNFPGVDNVNVAGPGFINITFKQNVWSDFLSNMLQNSRNWDKLEIGKGKNINIEYISADLGPERGVDNLETYSEVTNLLYKNNFSLIKINPERLSVLYKNNKLVEAQRLEQRTNFDLEMMLAAGTCPGIENYSRYLSGRNPGEPPPTLFEYLPDDALVFTDESHITVSQIGAMYKGDFRRKSTLAEYGFRLPSCLDNRPLKFEEWEAFRPNTIHVSATPGEWELNKTNGVFVEQSLRPTGLVDPEILIRPTKTQVDDLIYETKEQSKKGNRVLVTTLTKKMAEALSEYMFEAGLKVRYIHSDVDTLERIEIIRDLRLGVFDVLIGLASVSVSLLGSIPYPEESNLPFVSYP